MRLLGVLLLAACGSEGGGPDAAPADARVPTGDSALARLASSMEPGSWAELATDGIDQAFLATGGSSGFILGYAESMRWDPVSARGFYLGADHGGSYRFIAYEEATNAWTVLPLPPWYSNDGSSYSDAHGYDQIAIDPRGRRLFRRPYNGNQVHVYDLETGAWSALPDPPFAGEYGSC